MKWRLGFLLCCTVLITLAGATVTSGREAAAICCEGSAGCQESEVCCDLSGMGVEPCGEELAGYCMEACRRPGGVSFTPDQR